MLLLLGALPLITLAAEEPYSDDRWSHGSYCSTMGDMAGRRLYVYGIADSLNELTEDGTDGAVFLDADAPAGRLDTALMLYRICGTVPESPCPFSDVPEEYAESVAWLYEAGVTKGVGGGRYGTGSITRHQFLVMLSRYFQWDTEDGDEVVSIAAEQGLLPAYGETDIFTRGALFQLLCTLLDRYFPERRSAARPEMSPPYEIEITANTYADAVAQIGAALSYLPGCMTVHFSDDCPQTELDRFQSCFDWGNEGIAQVILGSLDHSFLSPYFMSQYKDHRYRLWLSHYSPAFEACSDALDWLRVYEDEAYSAAIRQFAAEHLAPLRDLTSDYERAKSAHDLLCRLAAYDYTEYYRNTRTEAHGLLGFLQNRKVVCDGYAKTYQWMLRYLGIDSYVVIGMGVSKSHAWNKVLLDGAWYNVDVCWDDSGSDARFFLKSDASFEANQHRFTDSFSKTSYASPKDYRR